jgi:hypothetical protein
MLHRPQDLSPWPFCLFSPDQGKEWIYLLATEGRALIDNLFLQYPSQVLVYSKLCKYFITD